MILLQQCPLPEKRDRIVKGETWLRSSFLYTTYDPVTKVGTPYDLTDAVLQGFITANLELGLATRYPLTMNIDVDPIIGKYYYSLDVETVQGLITRNIYFLRITVIPLSGLPFHVVESLPIEVFP